MKIKSAIKWILISAVTVIIIVILAGVYKFNYLANQPGYDCDGNNNYLEEKQVSQLR